MIKATYVIETEKSVDRIGKPNMMHHLCEVITEGYVKLREEGKGNVNDDTPVELIVGDYLEYCLSTYKDDFGSTARRYVKDNFPNVRILIIREDENNDKIVFRAFIR